MRTQPLFIATLLSVGLLGAGRANAGVQPLHRVDLSTPAKIRAERFSTESIRGTSLAASTKGNSGVT